ncbi:hypothetical protein BDF19DRAFT_413638 [Syncephalis fuscata]|nr:hypothetical protein BDF19DRAFT_413638 [Syncephalis fuscata]
MRREAKDEMTQQRRDEYEAYAKQFIPNNEDEESNDEEQESGSDKEEEEEEAEETSEQDPWSVQKPSTASFSGKTSTTTVTVITDINDEESVDEVARQSVKARAKAAVEREQAAEATKIQAQLEKLFATYPIYTFQREREEETNKKFRYDTKAVRKAAQSKIRATKSKRKAMRKQ